ncbi:MAG: DUF1295 domain-containing protein [Saprospiraceae bacterium]|nr:DUF1295 domain-containing protein [Saprospiraceae bacterium]
MIWETFFDIAVLVFCYATAWFIVWLAARRNDVADVAWGLGYALIALYLASTRGLTAVSLLVYGLTAIWALRLSGHIFWRNRGKTEDFRYAQWRVEWGRWFFLRSYLQVYLLQGLFLLVIAAPLWVAGTFGSNETGIFTFLGAGIWAVGFYFQAVGDYQLMQFLKTRKDKEAVLQTGLWRYSRHPNYFGEILIWWGLFLVVLPLEKGWWAIVSPLTITFLLVFVSGVPMLERRYRNNPAYQEYRKRTNALIPWFR